MGRAIDLFVTYRFIKLLVTPFEKTDAFKLGIIDADGKRILEPGTSNKPTILRTVEEKSAYTVLHKLVFNIKKILEKCLDLELSWEPMRLLCFFSRIRSRNLWMIQTYLRKSS